MDPRDPPADVVERTGIDPASVEPVEWRHPLWFVTVDGERAVLHRQPPYRSLADLQREAAVLTKIAPRFPVPEPIDTFEAHGSAWSIVTYLPGETPGWSPDYDLAAHGAFMAEFHLAVADLGLIHGDFTTLNVVARYGRPCGLIDFANAAVDSPLADLGAALWQAGRATFEGTAIDLDRVTAIVSGYHRVSPLPDEAQELIPNFMAARGHNLVEKWLDRGGVDVAPALERLGVIEASIADLRNAIATAARQ